MDAAVISLGGFMSQVLQFAAGIPQGRRFGVQHSPPKTSLESKAALISTPNS